MMEAFQGPQEGGWEVEILVRAPNTLPANLEALMQAVQVYFYFCPFSCTCGEAGRKSL